MDAALAKNAAEEAATSQNISVLEVRTCVRACVCVRVCVLNAFEEAVTSQNFSVLEVRACVVRVCLAVPEQTSFLPIDRSLDPPAAAAAAVSRCSHASCLVFVP